MTDVTISRETLQAALDAFQDIERMALIDPHHVAQLLMIGNRCTPIKDHLSAALAAQPAAPLAHADYPCRTDGRCQYAIDSGTEGLGHCPAGKCVMPPAPAAVPPADGLYNELLMAVASKYPGETRHQTALRYILRAEDRAETLPCELGIAAGDKP